MAGGKSANSCRASSIELPAATSSVMSHASIRPATSRSMRAWTIAAACGTSSPRASTILSPGTAVCASRIIQRGVKCGGRGLVRIGQRRGRRFAAVRDQCAGRQVDQNAGGGAVMEYFAHDQPVSRTPIPPSAMLGARAKASSGRTSGGGEPSFTPAAGFSIIKVSGSGGRRFLRRQCRSLQGIGGYRGRRF